MSHHHEEGAHGRRAHLVLNVILAVVVGVTAWAVGATAVALLG